MSRVDCPERDRGNHPVIGFILASLLIAVFSATVAHADVGGGLPPASVVDVCAYP
jgi:hypothetical protein